MDNNALVAETQWIRTLLSIIFGTIKFNYAHLLCIKYQKHVILGVLENRTATNGHIQTHAASL